ncbi:MAG: LysR family transcriptional regulator [bacterium]|nr:LysR family transcriptional regulator [bacterium]
MEFRQLRYFLEIHRAGSFVRAAAGMGLTQPALSRQISLLEREVGQSLLERGGREIRLTPAGEIFLGYAQRINELWQEVQDSLKHPDRELSGEYSLSAGGTVAAYVLPDVLKKVRKKYPHLVFRVSEGDAQETREALLRGDVDLGFLTGEVSESALVQKPYLTDRIIPVASKQHAIFKKNKPALKDLEGEDFVYFHPASAVRRVVEKKLRSLKLKFTPSIVMELRSLQGVIRSIEAGLGIGFVSEFCLTNKLRVLPFPELFAERKFYFSYRRHHRPGLNLLIEELEKHTANANN